TPYVPFAFPTYARVENPENMLRLNQSASNFNNISFATRNEPLGTTNVPFAATHFTDLRQNVSGSYGPLPIPLNTIHYNGFYGPPCNPPSHLMHSNIFQQNAGNNNNVGSVNETQRSNVNSKLSNNAVKRKKKKKKGQQVNEQNNKKDNNKDKKGKDKEKKDKKKSIKKKKLNKKLKQEAAKREDTWRSPKPSEKPWLIYNSKVKYTSVTQRLHYEVIELANYLLPTDVECLLRAFVIKRIELFIKKYFKNSEVMVFGSVNTGLYLPTSDLDIVCFIHEDPNSAIITITNLLKKLNISTDIPIMNTSAKVPTIKFQEFYTKFNVYISLNQINGYYSAVTIRRYMEQWPSLIRLVIVARCFLNHHNLDRAESGGMSGYTLFCLIMVPDDENLGVLLIEFFELYGIDFNYEKLAIRVKKDEDLGAEIGYCKKENESWATKSPKSLSIQDPIQKSNDIAKAITMMPKIREHFKKAFNILVNRVCFLEDNSQRNGDNTFPDLYKESILSSILFVRKEIIDRRRKLHQSYNKGKQLWQVVAPFGTDIVDSLQLPNIEYIRREFRKEIEDISENINYERTSQLEISNRQLNVPKVFLTKLDSQVRETLINNHSDSDMDLLDSAKQSNNNIYAQSTESLDSSRPDKGCGVQ
ncbi:6569_t:CDS:2, partial [Scutellospora calospora]